MAAEPHEGALVRQAIDEFDRVPLATTIRRALRIARLRGDLVSVWWLSMEHGSHDYHREIRTELAPHFSLEEFKRLHGEIVEGWIRERTVRIPTIDGDPGNEMVEATSARQLEERIEGLATDESTERAMGALQLAAWLAASRAQLQRVAENIRARVFDFLSRTEQQVRSGQQADVVVRARQFVIEALSQVAPRAVEQILEAEQVLAGGTPERYSHAVLSCRRALKSLADALYPSSSSPVTGPNGIVRTLTEERYVSRLWQFVYDRAAGHRSGELSLAAIEDLGRRIDAIYESTSKGVHDTVTEQEAHQFVLQTILLCGDLLRLRDRSSAIDLQLNDDLPGTSMPTQPP